MAWEELKSSGITEKTPENIMLGAGTIHKNLKFGYYELTKKPSDWATNYTNYYTRSGSAGSYEYTHVTGSTAPEFSAGTHYYQGWNFEESLIGATSGGTKVSIVPEIKNIEVDGALVKVKGLAIKVGEVANIETNIVEMTRELMQMCIVGAEGTSEYDGYDVIESKRVIEEGDYITNFGYIGHKITGEPIIIIFDYAICTSGMSVEGKNKENGVFPATFECYAKLSPEADILPYHIYTPTPTT